MAPSTLSSGLRSLWRASTRTSLGSVRPPLSRSVTPVTSISTVSPATSVPSLQTWSPHSPFSGLTLRRVTFSGTTSLTVTFVARTGPRLSTVIRYRTSSSGKTSGVSATFSIARSGSGTSPASVSVSLSWFGSPGVVTLATFTSLLPAASSEICTRARMVAKEAPAASGSERSQRKPSVEGSQLQPSPLGVPLSVTPGGSVSVTTVGPWVGASPTFLTSISKVGDPPASKSPVCLFMISKSGRMTRVETSLVSSLPGSSKVFDLKPTVPLLTIRVSSGSPTLCTRTLNSTVAEPFTASSPSRKTTPPATNSAWSSPGASVLGPALAPATMLRLSGT